MLCYEDKQYKLSDFIKVFSKFALKTDEINERLKNLDNNISKFIKNGKTLFKFRNAICPYCYSKKVKKIGFTSRNLIFLGKGSENCEIQRYKCKKFGQTFSTDLNSLVGDNKNITLPVIDEILFLYSIYGSSIYKI